MKTIRRKVFPCTAALTAFLLLALVLPVAITAQDQPAVEPGPVDEQPQTDQPSAEQPPAPGLQQEIPESGEVSEEELLMFAAAVNEVQDIQLEMQQEIETAIEESDLTRERFVEIFESTQAQGAEQPEDVSENEQEVFESLVSTISALQMSTQQSMLEAVQNAGMEPARFNQLLSTIQTDPELMARLQPHLQDNSPQQEEPAE